MKYTKTYTKITTSKPVAPRSGAIRIILVGKIMVFWTKHTLNPGSLTDWAALPRQPKTPPTYTGQPYHDPTAALVYEYAEPV